MATSLLESDKVNQIKWVKMSYDFEVSLSFSSGSTTDPVGMNSLGTWNMVPGEGEGITKENRNLNACSQD